MSEWNQYIQQIVGHIDICIKNEKDDGKATLANIQKTVDELNNHILSLSGIKEFESRLTPEYQKFRDVGISVSMKSEIAEKGFYSNIIPYIKQNDDENLYPTGGVRNYWLIQFLIFLQMKIQRKR